MVSLNAPGGSSLGCRIEDLPEEIFEPYDLGAEDVSSTKRALLSGSFLDEKRGGVFFFAHRSFQEFLVSEYLWNYLGNGTERGQELFYDLPNALTSEVYDFLIDRDDIDFFRSFLSGLIKHPLGMPYETFLIIMHSERLKAIATSKTAATISSWDAGIMVATAVLEYKDRPGELLNTCKIIARRASRKPTVILAAVKTLFIVSVTLDFPPDSLGSAFIALLFARPAEDIEALSHASVRQSSADPLRTAIFASVSAERLLDGRLEMTLDLDELFDNAAAASRHPIEFPSGLPYGGRPYKANFLSFFSSVPAEARQHLQAFFEKDAQIVGSMEGPTARGMDNEM